MAVSHEAPWLVVNGVDTVPCARRELCLAIHTQTREEGAFHELQCEDDFPLFADKTGLPTKMCTSYAVAVDATSLPARPHWEW